MTVVQILRRAKYLIRKPQLWCKGTFRIRNRRCAEAAVKAVCPGKYRAALLVLDGYCRRLGYNCLTSYNDSHKHCDVMSLFKRAIKSLAGKR